MGPAAVVGRIGDALDQPFRLLLARLDRPLDAVLRDRPAGPATFGLIAAWTLLWAPYEFLSELTFDMHFDLSEAVEWARSFAWSAPNHPPMTAWTVALWLMVFPPEAWSLRLLGVVNVGVSLWLAWLIACRLLPPDRRIAVIALLALMPLVTIQAFKFNANSVQMPWWALTTLFFLQSLETRRPLPAAVAGIAAAGAFLGKYYAVFLFAGLAAAALAHPARRAYFTSAAPFLTAAVGLAAIAPHLWWLATHEWTPLDFAATMHNLPPGEVVAKTLIYPLALAAHASLPVLAFLLAVRPFDAAGSAWRPLRDDWTSIIAFAAPLAISAVAIGVIGKKPTDIWTMPGWSLIGVILLRPLRLPVTRPMRLRLVALMLGLPVVMAAAAPVIALVGFVRGPAPAWAMASRIAPEVGAAWQSVTTAKLRFVGGDRGIGYGLALALPSRPVVVDRLPPLTGPTVPAGLLRQSGMAAACPAHDRKCFADLDEWVASRADLVRSTIVPTRRFLGLAQTGEPVTLIVFPPLAP